MKVFDHTVHEGVRSYRPGDVRTEFIFSSSVFVAPGDLFPFYADLETFSLVQKERGQSQGAQGARNRAEGS